MPSPPYKLFISYRSLDSAKVDKITLNLSHMRDENNTSRFIPWQDKEKLPPAHRHWWDAIVQAIIDNDVFVFHLSQEALKSDICKAELDYAHNRNRPIIPVVLEGEFFFNPQKGRYDLNDWSLVPKWLTNQQLLFYTGTNFYDQFLAAIAMFEQNWPRDIEVKAPRDPGSDGETLSNHAVYAQACEYAERLAFMEAEERFRSLVQRNDRDYAAWSSTWLRLLSLYADLLDIDQRYARPLFKRKWGEYAVLFPVEFWDGIFDPKGFAAPPQPSGTEGRDASRPYTLPPPPNTNASVGTPFMASDPADAQKRVPTNPTSTDPEWVQRWKAFKGTRNADWTPYIARFSDLKIPEMDFCLVPPGTFQMGSNDRDEEKPIHPQTFSQPFWIARTPVTNAQWRAGVQAGAVKEPQGDSSLKWYKDAKMADAPVTGVTWLQRGILHVGGLRLPTNGMGI
ncbi:SUMF1/EgtB/PvdO family nonheme iron enzyme, partial [bacterium]|nr:SUMF1/EgtB/PvdO family nonheme iron enzyme [bacterium]